MAVILWGAPVSDVLTWTPGLSGLAAGSLSMSNVIDNSTGLYQNALINFMGTTASAVCTGTPYFGVTALYSPDGVNFPIPPGASVGSSGVPLTASINASAGVSFTSGHSLPFLILPMKFKFQLYNGIGVTAPGGTVTFTLSRWAETVA